MSHDTIAFCVDFISCLSSDPFTSNVLIFRDLRLDGNPPVSGCDTFVSQHGLIDEDDLAFVDDSGPSSSIAAGTRPPQRPQLQRDQSTLTDLSSASDLPEIEIVSLISEELPKYKLRAGDEQSMKLVKANYFEEALEHPFVYLSKSNNK